ncbi:MAG: precorrin-2 dehydrogenase/sirohydrochlorin ferrochelatase family protein [Methanotrichaceae archaeon]
MQEDRCSDLSEDWDERLSDLLQRERIQEDGGQDLKLLLPLYFDLTHRQVVIFGGGKVGERKAKLFSQYAKVKVVSKLFTPELQRMEDDGQINLIKTSLPDRTEDHLKDAFIAIPATDDLQLNQYLEEKAREMNVLVNKIDGVGDVVVPSIMRREPITIAISTQGKSPALSKYIRLKLEEALDQRYGDMAKLLGDIRSELKQTVPHQTSRKNILWKIISDQEVWKLLEESYEKAYKRAREHVTRDERDSLDACDPPESIYRRD